MTRPVVIIGNLTVDDVIQADGTTSMGRPGGNAVYASVAARLWSDRVRVVARRGEDLPEEVGETLGRIGVTTAFREIPGPTVRNWVIYEPDGRRRWLYRTPSERPEEVAVRAGDVPPAWLAGTPVVHLAAMPLAAASALLVHVRRNSPGALITVDTHESWAGHPEEVLGLARQADVFAPSREELSALLGYDDPGRGSKELRQQGVRAIVVKLGDEGALADSDDGTEWIEAFPAEVVDTTGAGDSFCGGLAAGLAEGLSLVEATRRGALTASWSVARSGSLALAGFDPSAAGTSAGSYDIDVMRREIEMIPEVVARHLSDPGGHVQRIAEVLAEREIEHLFLVGCGDSHFAGLATALTFQRHTGIDARAVHAMEFARYGVRYAPPRSAVICVSFSGKVGRTTEAAVQAGRFGHLAIALTNDAHGRLAQAAASRLPIDVPTLGFSPGTSTYLAMVATLDDLALRWARLRGRDVGAARAMLDSVPQLAERTLAANARPAEETARALAVQRWITFLGAGPNEASSRFGAAKLFEGPQLLGVSTNIEEWAHEEYFVTGAGTPVVLVAPSGASSDRAGEILSELDYVGARPFVISDTEPRLPALHLPLAPGLTEEFSPLLAALPLSLIGFHLARVLGRESYNFPSEGAKVEHYDTIHRVTIGDPA